MESTAVSVIIPTWNERDNIPVLLQGIRAALTAYRFDVFVVDDGSPDGTGEAVQTEAATHPNIRLVSRPRKMGLSSAVMTGALASTGAIVVMMDADLSHNPALIPELVKNVEAGYDIAVGSRYVPGASLQGFPLHRRLGSRALTYLARTLLGITVRDPLSGFAAMRREVFTAQPTRFSAGGFKLLMEVLATQRGRKTVEVPITFLDRRTGRSKMGATETRGFFRLCWDLRRWQAKNARTLEKGAR